VGRAEQQAGKLPKPASIALLWENTSHGKDFRKGITDFAEKTKGYKVAVDESFELNGKDFSALLGQVKRPAPTCSSPTAPARLHHHAAAVRHAGSATRSISYGGARSESRRLRRWARRTWSTSSAPSGEPVCSPTESRGEEVRRPFKASTEGEPEWYQALGFETARASLHRHPSRPGPSIGKPSGRSSRR